MTLLEGNVVSGQFLKQDGGTFADGDYLRVYARWGDRYGIDVAETYYWDVTAGLSAFDYGIAIPTGITEFTLEYMYDNYPQGVAPYLNWGYYTTSLDGYCSQDASPLTGGMDHPETDIVLLKNHTVDGNLSLPVGETRPEPLAVSLGALFIPADGRYDTTVSGRYYHTVTIDANSPSTHYEFALPVVCRDDEGEYLVGYSQADSDYVRYGYYHSGGTVGLPSHGETLAIGQNHNDIHMQLLKGTEISGEISLPNGNLAPAGGVAVTLGALHEPGALYHTTVTILPETNAIPYTLRVAPDVGDVKVGYRLEENSPHASHGYYAESAALGNHVTGRYDFADTFSSLTGDDGNDFSLDYGYEVRGEIVLPEPAPQNVPIVITLAADPELPETIYWQKTLTVPDGQQTLPYSRRLVLDSDIVAQYSNDTMPRWQQQGYFLSTTESTTDPGLAAPLSAGMDHELINLFVDIYKMADYNNDGEVDLTDVILGLKVLTGMPISDKISTSADVNGDGTLGLPEVIHALEEVRQ